MTMSFQSRFDHGRRFKPKASGRLLDVSFALNTQAHISDFKLENLSYPGPHTPSFWDKYEKNQLVHGTNHLLQLT